VFWCRPKPNASSNIIIGMQRVVKLVLLGDGESPHLLKWARALAQHPATRNGLHAASSRGFLPAFDAVVPATRRLALNTQPKVQGGNVAVLRALPRLARWLHGVRPDWVHAHYLTSHGTLAWLSQSMLGVPGQLASSAWGSDVLVTPAQSPMARWLLQRVLRASRLATCDAQQVAQRMQAFGAPEVMVFPVGLEQLPPPPDVQAKEPGLWFANRGLEPIYAPLRVIDTFAALLAHSPAGMPMRLVVAHDGSMREAMQQHAQQLGVADRIAWTGYLDAASQAAWYTRAQGYLSVPTSDAVAVSLLEAMAHGCVPMVSKLPANEELVQDNDNGIVMQNDSPAGRQDAAQRWWAMAPRASDVAARNRAWVAQHAMFEPCVHRFVERLLTLQSGPSPRA
jgi:L-malate glycosyltransferase